MPRTVGIGHQDFEKLIRKNNFYIDKTMFIKEWWENDDDVTLITRPRRFGKTLNLSMVENFFSVEYTQRFLLASYPGGQDRTHIRMDYNSDEDLLHTGTDSLFQGLAIWEEETYRRLQGTWPVIFLSFAKVKERSFQNARKKICQLMTNLYNRYDFLLESGLLNEKEKSIYHEVNADMEDYLASEALSNLSDYLMRYYGKKVIILLDEYDTPMQEAYVGGYWDELISFMRNLFHSTFKSNPYLERALMTGITRVSKESVFSDLNNLEVVTTTSEKYEDSFGFTQEEVWEALKEYGLYEQREQVRHWYDGFTFGNKSDIYNPWSIINYLDKRRFSPYWANTSSNSLVGKLIREGSPDLKIAMEDLLSGRLLHAQIDEQVVFSMLDAMNTYINRVASATFSYFDTGKNPSGEAEPERFYHGFVLGLLVELSDRYRITSNRESGFGRYDVMLEPLGPSEDAVSIEFKVCSARKKQTLEDATAEALDQIDRMRYAADLEAKGIPPERIRRYGFAFDGKKVLIG